MISFKPIEKEDLPIVMDLMDAFYKIDNYGFDKATHSTLLLDFIAQTNLGTSWLLYYNLEEIGYIILTFVYSFEFKGKIAFLDELFIKESFRGKGFGSKSIQFIKEQAQLLNVKMLYLEVEEHNETALKLYLTNGFSKHHRKLMSIKI